MNISADSLSYSTVCDIFMEALIYVENKLAQPSTSSRSGGCSQRQMMPQAATRLGQPRPIR